MTSRVLCEDWQGGCANLAHPAAEGNEADSTYNHLEIIDQVLSAGYKFWMKEWITTRYFRAEDTDTLNELNELARICDVEQFVIKSTLPLRDRPGFVALLQKVEEITDDEYATRKNLLSLCAKEARIKSACAT